MVLFRVLLPKQTSAPFHSNLIALILRCPIAQRPAEGTPAASTPTARAESNR